VGEGTSVEALTWVRHFGRRSTSRVGDYLGGWLESQATYQVTRIRLVPVDYPDMTQRLRTSTTRFIHNRRAVSASLPLLPLGGLLLDVVFDLSSWALPHAPPAPPPVAVCLLVLAHQALPSESSPSSLSSSPITATAAVPRHRRCVLCRVYSRRGPSCCGVPPCHL
jgi:hypothetical protein